MSSAFSCCAREAAFLKKLKPDIKHAAQKYNFDYFVLCREKLRGEDWKF